MQNLWTRDTAENNPITRFQIPARMSTACCHHMYICSFNAYPISDLDISLHNLDPFANRRSSSDLFLSALFLLLEIKWLKLQLLSLRCVQCGAVLHCVLDHSLWYGNFGLFTLGIEKLREINMSTGVSPPSNQNASCVRPDRQLRNNNNSCVLLTKARPG